MQRLRRRMALCGVLLLAWMFGWHGTPQAANRKGAKRSGGVNSHGKGAHYVGGHKVPQKKAGVK